MLEILARVVEEPILKAIQSSVAIGLEVDESTDVSVKRQLDLHIRYQSVERRIINNWAGVNHLCLWFIFYVFLFFRYMDNEGQLFSQFLDLVNVSDGKAGTIVAAIKEVLHKKNVPTHKLYGLGTDGAAVMTGKS